MSAAPALEALAPRPTRVERVVRETADTFTFVLDVSEWPGGYRCAPGQFNMLYHYGVGEAAISVSALEGKKLHHTVRAVGSVTRALSLVRKGGTLGVRGPYGTAWPLEAARGNDLVFVAGGVGLAPLRSAIRESLLRRSDFGRVSVLYGARTPDDLVYAKELQRWRGRLDVQVEVSVDRASPGWRGHAGFVTSRIAHAELDGTRALAFVCGPEVMMRAVGRELEKRGLTDDRIFVSVERNMRCGVGLCGHCQLGPALTCRDGPVLSYERAQPLLATREL